MSRELQLVLVIGIVIVAALYAARKIGGQFRRSDDEPEACASCPARRALRTRSTPRSTPRNDTKR